MCGRYVSPGDASSNVNLISSTPRGSFRPSFNVAPKQIVPVIRMLNGERQGVPMRWALIPFFPKAFRRNQYDQSACRNETAAGYRGLWPRASAMFKWACAIGSASGR